MIWFGISAKFTLFSEQRVKTGDQIGSKRIHLRIIHNKSIIFGANVTPGLGRCKDGTFWHISQISLALGCKAKSWTVSFYPPFCLLRLPWFICYSPLIHIWFYSTLYLVEVFLDSDYQKCTSYKGWLINRFCNQFASIDVRGEGVKFLNIFDVLL